MRSYLQDMRLQNSTISNTHHGLIFLDVDGVINTTFSNPSSSNNELTNINYSEETIGKELAEYFLNNKGSLDSLVVYNDVNGDVAKLFPNNYLLLDTLADYDKDICQKVKELIIE